MRALVAKLQQARLVLTRFEGTLVNLPPEEQDIMAGLAGVVNELQAKHEEYQTLLARYHQLATTRNRFITDPDSGACAVLAGLATALTEAFGTTSKPPNPLSVQLGVLRGQRRFPCPADPFHPIHRKAFVLFRESNRIWQERCAGLIGVLGVVNPGKREVHLHDSQQSLEAIHEEIAQMTTALDRLYPHLVDCYQQQEELYHILNLRLGVARQPVKPGH